MKDISIGGKSKNLHWHNNSKKGQKPSDQIRINEEKMRLKEEKRKIKLLKEKNNMKDKQQQSQLLSEEDTNSSSTSTENDPDAGNDTSLHKEKKIKTNKIIKETVSEMQPNGNIKITVNYIRDKVIVDKIIRYMKLIKPFKPKSRISIFFSFFWLICFYFIKVPDFGIDERMREINERREKMMDKRKEIQFELRKLRMAFKIRAEKIVEEEEEEEEEDYELNKKDCFLFQNGSSDSISENQSHSIPLYIRINKKLDFFLLNDKTYNNYKEKLAKLDKKLKVIFYLNIY
jgi:hypothetical protein